MVTIGPSDHRDGEETDMKVRDIMKHEVVTCPLDSSLADAARLCDV